MTNYTTMAKRIRACKTLDDTIKVEKSMDKLFDLGIFTTGEFSRLDGVLVDHRIKLEN